MVLALFLVVPRRRRVARRPCHGVAMGSAVCAELQRCLRRHLKPTNDSWRMDETYVRVKGKWRYLYRAVDSTGATLDLLLSAKQDRGLSASAGAIFEQRARAGPPRHQAAGPCQSAVPITFGSHYQHLRLRNES